MKRDPDLVRELLLSLEALPKVHGNPATPAGRTDDEVNHHLALMIDADLIKGCVSETMGRDVPEFLVNGITWEGYEFLDAARDNGRWQKAKTTASGAGGVALSVLKELLIDLATKHLGIA
jgi:hypothetical protein